MEYILYSLVLLFNSGQIWCQLSTIVALAASPWDSVTPSPAPIRASGASKGSSSLRASGKSLQLTFSSATHSKVQPFLPSQRKNVDNCITLCF
jgi:hypothetical protein